MALTHEQQVLLRDTLRPSFGNIMMVKRSSCISCRVRQRALALRHPSLAECVSELLHCVIEPLHCAIDPSHCVIDPGLLSLNVGCRLQGNLEMYDLPGTHGGVPLKHILV